MIGEKRVLCCPVGLWGVVVMFRCVRLLAYVHFSLDLCVRARMEVENAWFHQGTLLSAAGRTSSESLQQFVECKGRVRHQV